MLQEMKFYFLALAFFIFMKTSDSSPISHPDGKQSRYIIDNRKNFLFGKPFTGAHYQSIPIESQRLNGSKTFDRIPKKWKDLSAEESAYQNYYAKYDADFSQRRTWTKVDNELKSSGYGYNAKDLLKKNSREVSDELDRFESAKESQGPNNLESPKEDKILHHVKGHYKEVIWEPKAKENGLISKTIENIKEGGGEVDEKMAVTLPPDASPTKPPFLWKFKEENLINDNSEVTEHHVYETRIETVSYHHEIILSPPGEVSQDDCKQQSETGFESNGTDSVQPVKKHREESVGAEDAAATLADSKQNKFGYVVEGENYRKYRIEERTIDGYIVGEYGVVSHDDGSLRGVRYTADSTISPRLIYEALMKFLSL